MTWKPPLAVLRFVIRWWTAFATLAALAMLGAAHAFERYGDLAPCPLCLRQREVYWAALAIALPATLWALFSRASRGTPRISAFLLLVVFGASAITAGFHMGGEYGWWSLPASCAGITGGIDLDGLRALATGTARESRIVACDAVTWTFAGLSMAGWNTLISIVLAVLSFMAAKRPRDARAPKVIKTVS